ncbi:MAG: TIGR03905 family TSCPD domain-containing protein [Oscillospiraceae bacterium]|nr:TIGR03905 family TSCPD domain-containing protein [Oscillospiraceae bacterium]
MQFTYKTKGVCSVSILIDIEEEIIKSVKYTGGCHGNLQGISALVAGMHIDDVIEKLEGIRCVFKNTSCPAQLADALKKYKAENL